MTQHFQGKRRQQARTRTAAFISPDKTSASDFPFCPRCHKPIITGSLHQITDCCQCEPVSAPKPMFVLIVGNPVDGIDLIGPFDTADAAHEATKYASADWWVKELTRPEVKANG